MNKKYIALLVSLCVYQLYGVGNILVKNNTGENMAMTIGGQDKVIVPGDYVRIGNFNFIDQSLSITLRSLGKYAHMYAKRPLAPFITKAINEYRGCGNECDNDCILMVNSFADLIQGIKISWQSANRLVDHLKNNSLNVKVMSDQDKITMFKQLAYYVQTGQKAQVDNYLSLYPHLFRGYFNDDEYVVIKIGARVDSSERKKALYLINNILRQMGG